MPLNIIHSTWFLARHLCIGINIMAVLVIFCLWLFTMLYCLLGMAAVSSGEKWGFHYWFKQLFKNKLKKERKK